MMETLPDNMNIGSYRLSGFFENQYKKAEPFLALPGYIRLFCDPHDGIIISV